MKVSQLATLLDALTDGLQGILGVAHAADVKKFRAAMQPFADEPVAAFTAFLGQCEEYRRTGIVTGKPAARPRAASAKPPADPNRIPKAIEAVKTLLDQSAHGGVTQQRIDEALTPFNAYLKSDLDQIAAGLTIAGKPKSKPDAIKKIRQFLESQVRMSDSARAIQDQ